MTIKALYPTIEPTLNLDFANTKRLDPRISFSRASTGTYVGADGLIKTAASGVARFDHDPATGESLGLLVEEARTNQALYSSDFSNVAWVEAATTKTANALVAPNGTITAALVVPTTGSLSHKLRQTITTTDSALTFSIYLKAAGYSRIALNEQAQTAASSAIINLADGTGATSGTTVTNAGNGWYRVSWSSTFGAGSTKIFCVVVLPNGGSGENPNSFTWAGDGTSGVYVWGAQVELGSFPTSYIPTVAATVTRAADVASMTGTNFSSWYRQDEGTLFNDFISKGRTTTNLNYASAISASGSMSNWAGIAVSAAGASMFPFAYVSSAGANWQPVVTPAVANASRIKAIVGLKSADMAFTINGLTPITNSTQNMPVSPNQLSLSVYEVNGTIARIAYYPVRLANAQLQALTAT